jgi:integrase
MCSMIANHTNLDFVLPGTLMFSDVIERLQADVDLSETRRRDLVSGLRRLAKALGRPPEDVPCDTRWLQKRLGKINPATFGIATKTWQNTVSDARAAMAQVGIVERKINQIDDLVPEWHRLWSLVLESKDPTLQPSLSRFVYFLNRRRVLPEDVRQEHADAFLQAIEANEISKSPQVVYRAAVNGWKLAARRIDAWPKTPLSLPLRQVKYILDIESFTPSFKASYEDLFRRMTEVDPFADAGPVRPVRPSTLKQYRRQLLRFASDLFHSGIAIDDVADIPYLLTPSVAERGLRHMLARNENDTNRSIAEMSGLLRNLGRILDVPEVQLKALQRLAARTALPPQKGMTRKNRNRLLILQDDRQTDRLLSFPDVLLRKAAQMRTPLQRGLAQEDAIAIAILLVCPLRIQNLSSIHLERNLQRPGDGRAFLVFEDGETKTTRPIQFELPQDILRTIDRHLKSRSPGMCPPGTPWLFPRRDGTGPVDPNQLSQRLAKRIRKETGLEVNAHLFRHFDVMLWLDARPGAYEAARHLLGHSTLSHTINMYSGLESTSAIKAFAEVVTARKGRKR